MEYKYNVYQVAQMFDVSADTIRRWIKVGDLKSEIDSRRSGHVISESNLYEFVSQHPKYAARMAKEVLDHYPEFENVRFNREMRIIERTIALIAGEYVVQRLTHDALKEIYDEVTREELYQGLFFLS